jgi:hypothetical protein
LERCWRSTSGPCEQYFSSTTGSSPGHMELASSSATWSHRWDNVPFCCRFILGLSGIELGSRETSKEKLRNRWDRRRGVIISSGTANNSQVLIVSGSPGRVIIGVFGTIFGIFFLDHSRLAHKRWTPSLVQKFRLVMDTHTPFFFNGIVATHVYLTNISLSYVSMIDPFKPKFSFSGLTIIITRLKELFVFKRMYDLRIIYAHKSLLTHKDRYHLQFKNLNYGLMD